MTYQLRVTPRRRRAIMDDMRYGVLGALSVEADDGPVVLHSAQQRLLLSLFLAAGPERVSVDRIAETLWPAALPGDPPAAVRTQVSRLRTRLGGRAIETGDGSYRLRRDETVDVDADRFRTLLADAAEAPTGSELGLLEAALALWRGPAFAEVADQGFAQPVAAQLEELRAGARERRSEILLQSGRIADALGDLAALVEQRPEREHARALLVRTLYRAGRQADALQVYETWRRTLAEELGVEPTPELREAYLAVLDHDVGRRGSSRGVGRLPRPTTDLIGRRDLLDAAIVAARTRRVITLHGTGGVGKTRLAVELVWSVMDEFEHGAVFCDLSAARHARDVDRYVATAVGATERPERSLADRVVSTLGDQHLLLVLDNCEQVIDAAAVLAARIARETPHVVVLATSRAPLRTDPEHLIVVAPLATGSRDSSATRLFVERARAACPDAVSGDEDLDEAVRACERLDGLPLAIELAAARAAELGIADITKALDSEIDVLATRRATTRHTSMTTVVDWSYGLLDETDRGVFEAVAQFADEFSIADVAARLGEAAVPCALALAERSLLEVRRRRPETRFRMLETLRSYAHDRLRARNALDPARDEHAHWVTTQVEARSQGLASVDEASSADWIGNHLADIRAASAWLVGRDLDDAARLALALPRYATWRMTAEAFRWIEATATAAAAAGHRRTCELLAASALGACQRGDLHAADEMARGARAAGEHHLVDQARGEVAFLTGDLEGAVSAYTAAYAGAEHDDPLTAAWALGSVALAHAYGDDVATAKPLAEQLLGFAHSNGSPSARAFAEFTLGEILSTLDPAGAEAHHRRAIELADPIGSRFVIGLAHVALASLYSRGDDATRALAHYESVVGDWHANDAWGSLRVTVRSLADLLERLGAYADAATLYGAVGSSDDAVPAFGADAGLLRDLRARLVARCPAEELARRLEDGRSLSDAQLATRALEAIHRIGPASDLPPRSQEVSGDPTRPRRGRVVGTAPGSAADT